VVPDGLINLVPFDALATRPPRDGAGEREASFLLDRFTISTAAIATAAEVRPRPVGRGVLIIAALDDEETRAEVAAIANATGTSRVAVLGGVQATRTAVLGALPGASIVHIAAHAEANEHDPDASFIQLAIDGPGENTMRAGDVAALRMRGSLVVLSACETASGRVLDGEGVLSVSRGFLRAGAAATVATLWPVGARSAEFSQVFYSSLAKGQAPAAAARTAKLAMRRAGAGAFAWAPYQVVAGPAVTNSTPVR
jgi:CHAT domain-containing protein